VPPSPDSSPPPSRPPPGTPPDIRIEGVHKSFDDNHVLRGITLEVLRGEMVALVGGSGSGKTVLLHVMTGLLRPDSGRVLVADRGSAQAPLCELSALSEEEMDRIRVHWSVVFQRNALFSGTVHENLTLWPMEVLGLDEAALEAKAREAIAAVGLDPGAVRDRDRDALSGGMAKRVAIARAVAMDPAMIFYDEPTSGLDPENAALIHGLIARTHSAGAGKRGARTTVIVTHDRDLLNRLSPRVVMLHKGAVHFDGSYRQFEQSDSPAIRPYFGEMPGLHGRRSASPGRSRA
jgi:phospholipid/cholesterol/gamma-HCH transport system ATP-binding protein